MNDDITTIQLTGPDWTKVHDHLREDGDHLSHMAAMEIDWTVNFQDDGYQSVDFTVWESEAVWEAMESLGMMPDGERE